MTLRMRHDRDSNALYVRVRSGRVAKTVTIDEERMIYADLARDGRLLGMEFVNADDFVPFLKAGAGSSDVAERLQEVAVQYG